MSKPQRIISNRLLAALPADEYKRLLPNLYSVDLHQGTILHEQDQVIHNVYFPNNAVLSLLSVTEDESTVEIGLISREGIIGVPLALGIDISPYRVMVQIPGNGMKMNVNILKGELKHSDRLKQLLLNYTYILISQISRSAACNHFHLLEARLCYWLLETDDRINAESIPYTHDFLAHMLGASRQAIHKIITELQNLKLIRALFVARSP
jgi:CRP-like cAMP-binding protein